MVSTSRSKTPRSSRLWAWGPLVAEPRRAGAVPVRMDYCQWGAAYQKPTTFMCSDPGFFALGRRCSCAGRREA
eukprot:8745510-Lingulodinium_polyedra.AAC.1